MNKDDDVGEKTKVAATSKFATLRNKRKRRIAEEHENEEEDVTTTDDIMDFQKDVCLNYSSILKFIKQGE